MLWWTIAAGIYMVAIMMILKAQQVLRREEDLCRRIIDCQAMRGPEVWIASPGEIEIDLEHDSNADVLVKLRRLRHDLS